MKGQTAMEYLATYGWSLFALFIVVALLIGTGIFSPDRFASEDCSLQPNMPCSDYFAYTDPSFGTLNVQATITNAAGTPILWRNATLLIPNDGGNLVGTVNPSTWYTEQGQSVNFTWVYGVGQNYKTGVMKKGRLNVSFSVCEGYSDLIDCATNAPPHTTAGRFDVYVRQG